MLNTYTHARTYQNTHKYTNVRACTTVHTNVHAHAQRGGGVGGKQIRGKWSAHANLTLIICASVLNLMSQASFTFGFEVLFDRI